MVSADIKAAARAFGNACSQTECHKDVLNVTRDLCDGKRSCTIEPSEQKFGYACEESYQYNLEVENACGKSSIKGSHLVNVEIAFYEELDRVNGLFQVNCALS